MFQFLLIHQQDGRHFQILDSILYHHDIHVLQAKLVHIPCFGYRNRGHILQGALLSPQFPSNQ